MALKKVSRREIELVGHNSKLHVQSRIKKDPRLGHVDDMLGKALLSDHPIISIVCKNDS